MKFAQLNLSPALCEEGFKNNSHNLPESPSPQGGRGERGEGCGSLLRLFLHCA